MIALVPVRGGQLPVGGAEAVAEAGGRVLLVGQGTTEAVDALAGVATRAMCCEQPAYAPAAWATLLAPLLAEIDVVVLANAPDGRDLAPRLAHLLDRPLLAGAVSVDPGGATVAREGGLLMEEVVVDGPFIATLQAGVRGVDVDPSLVAVVEKLDLPAPAAPADHAPAIDPPVVEVLPPDPATMDLAEAPGIVGGGAGLGSEEVMDLLGDVADRLGCSIGGTRVVTDWGWLPFERQIGTTGVIVHPELYLAFGISGAVQHVSGLGDPAHVIAVNTDASCPMMSIADLAVVTDAPALVAEL
ncbi:MAG: mycofactocin-associated electron transfer flavoprotein alpha subunit, partial [Acidimicrobiales bacterium]